MNSEPLRQLLTARDDGFFGVYVGIVSNNQDPDNMHRVKVRFPWLSKDHESNWARLSTPMAGNDRGIYFLPEVDDEVLVAFEQGRVDQPYVIGSLWNGKDQPPESNQDGENNPRTIKSRSGHVIRLNDQNGQETIEIIDKTKKNKIIINAADNTIIIEAESDIEIKSISGKLKMSAVGIEMKSQAGIEIEAASKLKMSAVGTEMKSQAGVKIEAASNMDLKASALINVKGALVKLN